MASSRLVLLLALGLCGCGSTYFTGLGHDAAQGALNAVTSDAAKKQLSGLSTAATKAARDEALGPTTDAELQKLVLSTGKTTRAQVDELVAGLITEALQAKLKQTVRQAIDEAFGKTTLKEAAALREELVGTPLQQDLDHLIDAAAPRLAKAVQQAVQASVAPLTKDANQLKTEADQEAAKWRPVAIGFAVGAGILLICLIFSAFVILNHRRVIEALAKQRAG